MVYKNYLADLQSQRLNHEKSVAKANVVIRDILNEKVTPETYGKYTKDKTETTMMGEIVAGPVVDMDKIDEEASAIAEKYNIPPNGAAWRLIKNNLTSDVDTEIDRPQADVNFKTDFAELNTKRQELFDAGFKADETIYANAEAKLNSLEAQYQQEAKNEFDAIDFEYKTKADQLNKEYAQYTDGIKKQQESLTALYQSGQIDQLAYESAWSKLAEDEKAFYENYKKEFPDNAAYVVKSNEINSRYNRKYELQKQAIASRAEAEMQEAYKKYALEYKEDPELLKKMNDAYRASFEKATQQRAAKMGRAAQLSANPISTFYQSAASALGGVFKGWGGSMNSKTLEVLGESMEQSFMMPKARTKEFSDWIDPQNVILLSGQLAGSMLPSMTASAVVAIGTQGAGLPVAAQLIAGGLAGWASETVDIVGRSYLDRFEGTGGNVAEANLAAERSLQSQYDIMFAYSLDALPFVGKALKFIPTIAGRVTAGAGAELLTEMVQEYPQNIADENIQKGNEPWANLNEALKDTKRMKETLISIGPVAILGGAGQIGTKSKKSELRDAYIAMQQKSSLNNALPDQKRQYIQNMVFNKNAKFAKGVIGTLFASGKIDEKTSTDMLVEIDRAEKIKQAGKSAGLSGSKLNIYGFYSARAEEAERNAAKFGQDPILSESYKQMAKQYRDAGLDFMKGGKPDLLSVTYADGSQALMVPEDANALFSDANALNLLSKKAVSISAYKEGGQGVKIIDELKGRAETYAKKNRYTEASKMASPLQSLRENIKQRTEQLDIEQAELTEAQRQAEIKRIEQEETAAFEAKEKELEQQKRDQRDVEIEQIQQQREALGVNEVDAFFSDMKPLVGTTVERMEQGKPAPKSAVKVASDYLYAKYKELTAMKSDPNRMMTIAQIESIQAQIEQDLETLEGNPPSQKTEARDQENIQGVPGEVREGKKPVAAEPVEVPSTEAPEAGGVLQAQEEVDPKKVAVEKAQKQLEGVDSRINPNAKHPFFNVGQKYDTGFNLDVRDFKDERKDPFKDGVDVITKIHKPATVDKNGKMTSAAEVEVTSFDSIEQAQEYVNSQYNKYKAMAEEKLAKANAELSAPEGKPTTEAAPEPAPTPFQKQKDLLGEDKQPWMYEATEAERNQAKKAAGKNTTRFFPKKISKIEIALQRGWFEKAIEEGRMTPQQAADVISSADLEVPASITEAKPTAPIEKKAEPKAESDRRAARRKALQEEETPAAETETESDEVEKTTQALKSFDKIIKGNKTAGTEVYQKAVDLITKKKTHEFTGKGWGDVAEAYHKALKNGSNPELVNLIDSALKTAPETKPEPKTKKEPVTEKKTGKKPKYEIKTKVGNPSKKDDYIYKTTVLKDGKVIKEFTQKNNKNKNSEEQAREWLEKEAGPISYQRPYELFKQMFVYYDEFKKNATSRVGISEGYEYAANKMVEDQGISRELADYLQDKIQYMGNGYVKSLQDFERYGVKLELTLDIDEIISREETTQAGKESSDEAFVDEKIEQVKENGKPLSEFKEGDRVIWANDSNPNFKQYIEGVIVKENGELGIKRSSQNPLSKKYPVAILGGSTLVIMKPEGDPIYTGVENLVKKQVAKTTEVKAKAPKPASKMPDKKGIPSKFTKDNIGELVGATIVVIPSNGPMKVLEVRGPFDPYEGYATFNTKKGLTEEYVLIGEDDRSADVFINDKGQLESSIEESIFTSDPNAKHILKEATEETPLSIAKFKKGDIVKYVKDGQQYEVLSVDPRALSSIKNTQTGEVISVAYPADFLPSSKEEVSTEVTNKASETKPPAESERRASRRQKMQEEGGTKISEAAPSVRRAGAVEASESDNPIVGAENTLAAAGMNETSLNEWKKANEKDSKKGRIEELAELVRNLMSGKIKFKDYYEKAKQLMPSKLMDKVPAIASFKEIAGSIDRNKLEKGIINLNKFIKKGTRVGLRIDIPAFNRFGKNVVTVHEGKGSRSPIGYGSTGSISNVTFRTSVSTASKIGAGEDKSAFAMAVGEWMDESPESIQKRAEEALNSPEWVQVSMNPTRSSFFFDKADGNPVVAADEVLQVGNLVLAKNPQKIDLNTKEGMAQFENMFSAKTKEGVTYQYRKGQPESERRAARRMAMQPDVDKAIADIERGLSESGITVEVKDDSDYNNDERIKGSQSVGSEGVFIAEDGTIILNRDKLKSGLGKTIIFHEGVHPIINIIRNTDPKRYAQIVEGIKREAARNKQMAEVVEFANSEENTDQGPEKVEDELVAETISRVASGKLDVSKVDRSLKNKIISFINDALRALGLPTIPLNAPDQEFRKVAQQISDLFNKGGKLSDIVGAENVKKYQYTDLKGNPISDSQRSLHNSMRDAKMGFILEYLANDAEFEKLKADGNITEDKVLDDFIDKFFYGHSPDAAFTGNMKKKGPAGEIVSLVEGKGGVFYPLKFIKDLFVWASTSTAANSMAAQLNKNAELNDGSIYLALVSAPADKLLSSTTSSNGVVDIFKAMSEDPEFKLKKNVFKNALLKAAKAKQYDSQGKIITLGLKNLTLDNSVEEIEQAVRQKLAADQSTFKDRKLFSETFVSEFARAIKSTPSEQIIGEFLIKGLETKGYKQQGGKTETGYSKYSLSPANLIPAISQMMSEPMLKGEGSRKIYAVIEVKPINGNKKSSVVPVDSDKHESYPKAIKVNGDNMKVIVHILQDREDWASRLADPETGKLVTTDREKKIFPTSGVTTTSLKVLPKSKAPISAQPSFGGRVDVQNAYLDAMDAVDDAVDAGTSPAQAIADNITSQDWYKSLSSQDKAQVNQMVSNEFGEDVIKAPKAAAKPKAKTGLAATISNIVDNYYKIKDGERAEKTAARDAINEILDSDPKLKYIYDNIREINKQLQAAGVITDKTDGCP